MPDLRDEIPSEVPHSEVHSVPCAECAQSLEPKEIVLRGNQPFCSHCAAIEDKERPQPPRLGLSQNWSFQVFQAPMILGLIIVLLGLYGFSAWPHWDRAHVAFLNRYDLDLRAIVERHEYWRLLTANLLHANLQHIAMNALAIFLFGSLLEGQIGPLAVLAWCVIGLIGCDIGTILCQVPDSIGASGIAYGLQAGFILLNARAMVRYNVQAPGRTLRSLLGYLILIVLFNWSPESGINVYGHLGGAMAGLLCAACYPLTSQAPKRIMVPLLVLFLMSLGLLDWVVQGHWPFTQLDGAM